MSERQREMLIKRNTKHAHARRGQRTPTYNSWRCMMERCCRPNHAAYPHYGGSNVLVCERWFVFENFLADMGERPAGTTLDRYPHKRGHYRPGNVRWATASEQNRNRRPPKRKPRRSTVAEINAYAASLARAASPPGGAP
jgi:hypothetical protein